VAGFSPARQRADAICRRLPQAGRVVEVGVLIGALSREILKRAPDCWLEMVDNWLPIDLQPEAYKATGDDHALHDRERAELHYSHARAVVAEFRERAAIRRGDSVKVAESFMPGSVDLVFLDADHSFEGVTADLAAWESKVKPGGWIGGHDYRNPDPRFRFGVTEAVDAWAARTGRTIETDLNFTWFARL
jgi:predicted O-methyltransferase YrrM